MAAQIEVDDSSGRVTGVTYFSDGQEFFQPAHSVAICGYAIETPRLMLNSTSKHHPNGIGNAEDLVGRFVMVQGAVQTAGRFDHEMRVYKAPPPEISSEQFYETDESRGFARGFSIQTVGPLPIDWAEHVAAEGHWGRKLRDYMSDYIHWSTLGVLCELLPQAENRVTLAPTIKDQYGLPATNFSHSLCENDKKSIAYAKQTLERIWEAAGAGATMTIDRYAHLVGGARMGFRSGDSVVDSSHRVWGVPNLFIVDGSVFPTEGSANPALVIMALADRCADLLKNKRLS
jgi:choline dehydrogenase-like flavoprotein